MANPCLILGNGPSLNDLPDDLYLSIPSFGMNYAKHQTDYYCCVDHELLTIHHRKIYNLAAMAKIAFLALKENGSSDLYDLPNVQMVTHDKGAFLGEHYFSGLTVTYVALKCAFYLGFDEVVLYGVDHDKEWKHWTPDYPPGDVDRRAWRMAEMRWHFQHAMNVYKANGRKIINRSYPSPLDAIFEREK